MPQKKKDNAQEAELSDHKRIGQEQNLFLVSQEVGSGLPMFAPKGLLLRREVEQYITQEKEKRGYSFVWTPHIGKVGLYKKSGHWQKYDAMFTPMKIDDEEYVLKPMNCPHHFQIYLERPRSYRDMPLRLAENATVYRYEKSGEVNGLLRARALTQDDSHNFVRHDQIGNEIGNVLDLMETVYQTFGFKKYKARISVRDPNNKKGYLGSEAIWKEAEQALIQAAEKRGMEYFIGEGEAAFYGPKIDVVVQDSLGREWQLTTCQLDFNQPENFDLTYIDEQGKKARPAILHIAILGSIERFMGVYIEHVGGSFPLWLSPEQVRILPISDALIPYAKDLQEKLSHLRVKVQDESETLGKKIREGETEKIPYLIIVGEKEKESGTVSVRKRGKGDLGAMTIAQFIDQTTQELQKKL
ncbi:MAG: threonine--tRNA ligase [bacterium]|nr:threonine--tRNA ligase [bacterium]